MTSAPLLAPLAPTRAKSAVVNLAECDEPGVIARYARIAASIARKSEDVLGFPPAEASPRTLSFLSCHLRVFLDASLGRSSDPARRTLPKIPHRLFSDYAADGALEVILSTCLRFKASSGLRRLDLLNTDKHNLYLDMVAMIAKNLTRASFLPPIRILITSHVPADKNVLLRAHVQTLCASVVEDAEQATHVLYSDPEGCSPEETDGTDYCRTLALAPPHALVHWWYHPDSYDSWIPLADVQGDPEPDIQNNGPWFVGMRWLFDSVTFNEWMNELDYEIPDELRLPFPGSEQITVQQSACRVAAGSGRSKKKKRKNSGVGPSIRSTPSNTLAEAPLSTPASAVAAGSGFADEDDDNGVAAVSKKASKKRKRVDSKFESRDRPRDRDDRYDRDRDRSDQFDKERRHDRDRERGRERSSRDSVSADTDATPVASEPGEANPASTAGGDDDIVPTGLDSQRKSADERNKRARTDVMEGESHSDAALKVRVDLVAAATSRDAVPIPDGASSTRNGDQQSNSASFKVRVKMPTENRNEKVEADDNGNDGIDADGCGPGGDADDDEIAVADENPATNLERGGTGANGLDRDRKKDRDRHRDRDRDRERSGRRSKSRKKERRKIRQDGVSFVQGADPIPEVDVRRIRNISIDTPDALPAVAHVEHEVMDSNESDDSDGSSKQKTPNTDQPEYRATAVPGNAFSDGKAAGAPVSAADLIESLPQMPIRIPAQSRWFRMDAIHDLEQRSLPEFFNNRSPSKTPKVYKVYRDFMIDTWRQSPSKYLTATSARRHLAGDVCAILRVHSFLEHWGLINFGVEPDTRPHHAVMKSVRPEPWNAAPLVEQAPHTNAPGVAVETGIPRLLLFDEAPAGRRSSPSTSLKAAMDSSRGKTAADVQLATRREVYAAAAAIKYDCDACGQDCSRMRYHCVGLADVDLCPTCFADGRYPTTLSARDFEQLTTVANSEAYDGSVWSEAEVLLLLEGLEQYGDNWNAVAAHVGTKSNEQCVIQFLRMPIEDSFLGDQLGKWGRAGEKGAAALAASGEHIFASAPMPFADTSNPVMAQVAFLASSVSPEVAAAAAQAALTKIMLETNPPNLDSNPDSTPVPSGVRLERFQLASSLLANGPSHQQLAGVHMQPSGKQQQQRKPVTSSGIPGTELDSAAVQAAAAVGLAAAAARARKLADSEVREIERVFAVVVETKLRIIEEKMRSFSALEDSVRAERDKLERQRQVLYADRVSAALARAGGRIGELAVDADVDGEGPSVPVFGEVAGTSQPFMPSMSPEPVQTLNVDMTEHAGHL
jgi:SWIRM-associated domain at the N-terminal/SWIRM domain/SWIRM-associated region 1/Myb-like DNA-binding domain/Zinc finger, ZZ type